MYFDCDFRGIVLAKDGTIYRREYDEEKEDVTLKKVPDEYLMADFSLQKPVYVEDGFTLLDYFNLFRQHEILILLVPEVQAYLKRLDEKNLWKNPGKTPINNQFIGVSKYNEASIEDLSNYSSYASSELYIPRAFVEDEYLDCALPEEEYVQFGLELSNFEEFLTTPIMFVKPTTCIMLGSKVLFSEPEVGNQRVILSKTNNMLIFRDFLVSPIFEFGFFGDPEDVENKKKEFDIEVEECRKEETKEEMKISEGSKTLNENFKEYSAKIENQVRDFAIQHKAEKLVEAMKSYIVEQEKRFSERFNNN